VERNFSANVAFGFMNKSVFNLPVKLEMLPGKDTLTLP
jgi:hypothetical protein